MATTAILNLTQLQANQLSPEVVYNDNLLMLDILVQTVVLESRNNPPASPVNGNAYIIGTIPTGDWATHAQELVYYASGWKYFTPKEGWRTYNLSDNAQYIYDGSIWVKQDVSGEASTSTFRIFDSTDNTKKIAFDASNITTGTTAYIVVKTNSAYILKDKYDGTTAPVAGDDSADGYSVGSRWIDVTNDHVYMCVDNTLGNAVWKQLD